MLKKVSQNKDLNKPISAQSELASEKAFKFCVSFFFFKIEMDVKGDFKWQQLFALFIALLFLYFVIAKFPEVGQYFDMFNKSSP